MRPAVRPVGVAGTSLAYRGVSRRARAIKLVTAAVTVAVAAACCSWLTAAAVIPGAVLAMR
eukprot:8934072-Lingulodinium_polyedra.AAC.1